MATFYDVTFHAATNEDLTVEFALTDDVGEPYDLSTAALAMELRGGGVESALRLDIANGRITIRDAATGQFTLHFPRDVLETLRPRIYEHDLVMTDGGSSYRIWNGVLSLEKGVTQS